MSKEEKGKNGGVKYGCISLFKNFMELGMVFLFSFFLFLLWFRKTGNFGPV